MKTKVFLAILSTLELPAFLVKLLLKTIYKVCYFIVSILYSLGIIAGFDNGKRAYALISVALLLIVYTILK